MQSNCAKTCGCLPKLAGNFAGKYELDLLCISVFFNYSDTNSIFIYFFIGCELKDKELAGYAGGKRVTYKTVLEATEACKSGKKCSESSMTYLSVLFLK